MHIIKAKHIIVVADTCYSGTIIVERSKHEEISNKQKNKNEYLAKKHKKKTRVAITSGDIGEKVADREKLSSKHSPFAEVLIKILNDNNNILYSSELHAKIEKEIMLKELDQQVQWGKIIGTGHIDGGDFPFQKIQ